MCHHAGFRVGELTGGKLITAPESLGHWVARVALYIYSFVDSSYWYYCCYCSLRLMFLLTCPYPDPRVFTFFFPFFSPQQWWEGRQSNRMALCCCPRPNDNTREILRLLELSSPSSSHPYPGCPKSRPEHYGEKPLTSAQLLGCPSAFRQSRESALI